MPFQPPLELAEVRVLGALLEKEATTPDVYPLSLNGLVTACNQKTNRDPVVEYDDATVEDAIERLRERRFAFIISGSRVTKYSQRISETLNLGRRETAVLCVLLLRGPQTLGEIKDRSERIYRFGDLSETEGTLDKLSSWAGDPLVVKLGRQPGQKEIRYAHLLAGEPAFDATEGSSSSSVSRVSQLESEIADLRREIADLKDRFDALEAQFR